MTIQRHVTLLLFSMTSTQVPDTASAAVLLRSEPVPDSYVSVRGPDFDKPLSLQQFLQSYERIGFQANSLGKAIDIVNRMVKTADISLNVNSAHIICSVPGACQMNQYPKTNPKNFDPLKFVNRHDATYF